MNVPRVGILNKSFGFISLNCLQQTNYMNRDSFLLNFLKKITKLKRVRKSTGCV